jgi:hypothetical protein
VAKASQLPAAADPATQLRTAMTPKEATKAERRTKQRKPKLYINGEDGERSEGGPDGTSGRDVDDGGTPGTPRDTKSGNFLIITLVGVS